MTGERDDDIEFDDEFVIEETELGEDFLDNLEAEDPVTPETARDEEFFVVASEEGEGQAAEPPRRAWAGADIDLAEIVEPTVSAQGGPLQEPEEEEEEDPFAIDDVEVEVLGGNPLLASEPAIDDFAEEAAAPASTAFGGGRRDTLGGHGHEAMPAASGVEDHAEEWELQPVDALPEEGEDFAEPEDEVDPIYGAPAHEAAATFYEPEHEEEVDWSEHEEAYADEAEPEYGEIVGTVPHKSTTWRRLAAAAAVIFVIGGAVAVRYLPDRGGARRLAPVSIDRVVIARPAVDLALLPPDVALPPPVAVEVPQGGDPLASDPDIVPPIDPTHVPFTLDPVTGPEEAPSHSPVALPDRIPFGEEIEIGPQVSVDTSTDPFPEILPGVRAYAVLLNDSVFVGVVRKRDTAHVTLDIAPGEVQLAYADLRMLTPIEGAGGDETIRNEDGSVQLTNAATMEGRVVLPKGSDTIIVETETGRVALPLDSVTGIAAKKPGGVEIVEENDPWVEQQARRTLLRGGDPAGTDRALPVPATPGTRLR